MRTHGRLIAAVGITVGCVLALVAALAVAARMPAPAADGQPAAHGPASCETPGPHRLRDGIPAGYEHSGRGAVAAASNAVAVIGDPRSLHAAARAGVLLALAATGAAPELERRLAVTPAVEEVTGLLASLAGDRPVVARVVPAAHRLAVFTGDAATVQVWAVSVLGTDRLGVVGSSWSTETLQLVWERGDWRIRGYASRAGPVPAATQPAAGLAETVTATEAMRGYSYAPAR